MTRNFPLLTLTRQLAMTPVYQAIPAEALKTQGYFNSSDHLYDAFSDIDMPADLEIIEELPAAHQLFRITRSPHVGQAGQAF